MTLLLDGAVVDERDQRIATLERENARLRSDLRSATDEIEIARAESQRSVTALRKQLAPLYRALQVVFGELDAIGGHDDGSVDSMPARHAVIWDSWKKKMPGKPAEFISILLEHGDMNAAQLKIAGKCSSDTVYQTIYKLSKAGLINKNGGRFSLKEL